MHPSTPRKLFLEVEMKGGRAVAMLAVGSLLVAANTAEAQHRRHAGTHFGVSFVAADAQGAFGTLVDQGFGAEIAAGLPMSTNGQLRLRMDGGFMVYGLERIHFCDFGCRTGPTLTTTNNILYAGIGPEFSFNVGNVQPYIHGTAGISWFLTSSSMDDHDGYGSYYETTNFSDTTFGLKYGGGLRVRMGHTGTFLDIGVVRHDHQTVEYLTKGDIVDNDDGSVTLFPNRSEADLLSFRLGLSFGLR